jgi:hypothetical protein
MSRTGYYRTAERRFDEALGIRRTRSGAIGVGRVIVPPKQAFVQPSVDGYHRHKSREGPGETVTTQYHGQAELPSKVEPQNPQIAVAPMPPILVSVGSFTFRWPDLRQTGGRVVA